MIALLLLAVLVLVLLNAFFVAAEFALVRSRKAHLQTDADLGKKGAATAVAMMDDLSRYLSAAQVGITLTSLGLGFLGEPAIGSLLEDLFGEEVPHWVSATVSVTLAYLITTAIHITLGEQVPKIYSIQKAEGVARRVARPLLIFSKVFHPFIEVLNTASNGILRLLGVRTSGQLDEGESPEELRVLIQESVTGGKLDPGEAGMLTGVFHLHEQQARQVMTPAPAVVTVDVSENVETALRRCVSSGHTRLVVTEDDNHDRVKGIVHANQLAQLLLVEGPAASIEGLVREAPIVPETKPLDDLLADLQRERSSLAVVIDEYGRTAGIVTVEDIIEEVVGEIDDETDPLGGAVRRLSNGDWVTHNGYSIRVESVRENRIEAVRIRERRATTA